MGDHADHIFHVFLRRVTFKNSGGTVLRTVDYSYDVFNRLVKRTYDADGPGTGAATSIYWSYEGDSINPSLEFSGSAMSNLSHRYLWGPAVDQLFADEQVTSLTTAGNTLWALSDHLGTIKDIADLSGSTTTITNHRRYNAFGSLTSESNAAVDMAFQFTGKYFDEITGLQLNLNRWFDSRLGQWISEDPIGFAGGDENLRRYVGNDPQNATDPSGLAEPSIWDIHKALQYALLATGAYPESVNDEAIKKHFGWEVEETYNDKQTGFRAVLWKNGAKRVLAFAGTQDRTDGMTDVCQGAGIPTEQFKRAAALAVELKAIHGDNLEFTGHSLGGALASVAAGKTNLHAITFNAAGLHLFEMWRADTSTQEQKQLVEAYRVYGEILSSLQDIPSWVGLGAMIPWVGLPCKVASTVGWLMPDGVGNPHWIWGTSRDPLERHKMPDVIDGLLAEYKRLWDLAQQQQNQANAPKK